MGGDQAPAAAVEGAVLALQESSCSLVLVGDETAVCEILGDRCRDDPRLRVVHAAEVVGMNEPAITPIWRKRDSSIRVCAELVKRGEADGMVSAGNTGAAMIVAKMVIGTIDGVDRPALSMLLPNPKGSTLVLDVGANIDTKAEYLRQFAVMGHAYAQQILGMKEPRIGLLSIGEEAGKGTDLTREVFQMMESSVSLNFVGNVEGDDVFAGTVDVIICDGFVGNVMLKSCESIVESIGLYLREEVERSWVFKLGYLLGRPAIERMRRRLDYSEYGAAPLLGIQGGCLIGHGRSNANAIKNALVNAAKFCEAGLHRKLRDDIAELHRIEAAVMHSEEAV